MSFFLDLYLLKPFVKRLASSMGSVFNGRKNRRKEAMCTVRCPGCEEVWLVCNV